MAGLLRSELDLVGDACEAPRPPAALCCQLGWRDGLDVGHTLGERLIQAPHPKLCVFERGG